MSYILLIESNGVLASLYTQALQRAGFRVARAVGAQSGITAADKQCPDIVILDIELAEHSGVEFLHEFRSYSEWQNIPVIINTALPPVRAQAVLGSLQRDFGITNMLYKPRLTLDDLVRTAQQALRQANPQ